jgi:carbonic anhydrase
MNTTRAIVSILLSLALFGARAEEQVHEWAYTGEHGPQHWADVKADFAACGVGKTQSPIDIHGAASGSPAPIKFDYHAVPLHITDNGHTVQVTYAAGSSITVRGKHYELAQFHFHHPSEERIEGKGYPMVAHLVHKSADGALAVVAVLLREGAQNPLIATLWKNLPADKEKEVAPEKVTINAARLLPVSRAYYEFAGSLTTPPCSEGVTWLVLATPVELSASQISRFTKIYSSNARPLQALNGRAITLHK